MASHTVRLQKARYDMAEDLARAGHSAEAIDICWGLRADPALSRWNMALVNLLLVTELDVENYPDAAKFANEAIDLSQWIYERAKDPADKDEMIRVRRHAQGALEVINENLEIVRAERQAKAQTKKEATVITDLTSMQLDEPRRDRKVTSAPQASDVLDALEPLLPGDIQVPWRIEGAYTQATRSNPGKSPAR